MNKKILLLTTTLLSSGWCLGQNSTRINPMKEKKMADNLPAVNNRIINQNNHITNILLWGVGSGTGVSAAEFSTPFINSTSFTPGSNSTSWTALSINQAGGSVTPGVAYWKQNMTGSSQGAYASGLPVISSPSQANGVAIFDSDYMDNGGVIGAFGTGTSPSPHKGLLISPSIDLTGYTDSAIAVSFYASARNFDINELSLSISTDGGATWSASGNIMPYLGSPNVNQYAEGMVTIPFASVLSGVSNLTDVRLRFTFDGDYYFAMIDDISISLSNNYDFTIAPADPAGSSFIEKGDQVLLSNNRYFLLSQLTAGDFYFGANVKNYGVVDAFIPAGVQLNLTIQQFTGSWNTVYTQSTGIDTVLADDTGTLVIDSLTNLSWLQAGEFRAIYTVSSTINDGDHSNDSLMHMFTITDNYASKVDLNLAGKPFASSSVFPGGGPYTAFEFGSMFKFPTGGNENLKIDSISFTYRTSSGYIGGATNNVFVKVSEWNDLNMNGTPDDTSEFTVVGISNVSLNGLTAGNYYSTATSAFINPSTSNPMGFLQNKTYYVSLLTNTSISGGAATFGANDVVQYGISDLQNYNLNLALIGLPGNSDAVSTPIILTQSGATTIYTGFSSGVYPSIGVHVSACVASAGTDVQTACDSLTWIDGLTYYANNNTATFALTNAAGCDSIVTLNLTVNTLNTGVTNNAPTLTADEAGATYQWIDCDNANAAISGETAQSFTASTNGNYAVVVTKNGCSDTSACQTVNNIGFRNINDTYVKVFPVPANENLNISGINFGGTFKVELIDQLGRVVLTETFDNVKEVTLSTQNLTQGTYQLKVNTASAVITKAVVIIK